MFRTGLEKNQLKQETRSKKQETFGLRRAENVEETRQIPDK